MNSDMESFTGDLSRMWKLQERPPLNHLTWDWWWWLLMLDDENGNPSGKQLMVLWSTKDNSKVIVSDTVWEPKGRPGFDDESGIALDGMVCAWWYDGKRMHEPLIKRKCRIITMDDTHSKWPEVSEDSGRGGGAVVPLLDDDLSMGLKSDLSEFWLNLTSDEQPIPGMVPQSMKFQITPWNDAMSTARHATATYAMNMGYDILRLHGCKVEGTLDDQHVKGTAYFQKVCVQAPSPPWFWGMLHLDDGSYIDWFLPHVSPTITAKDSRPWKKRDITHLPLSMGGLFHDVSRNRSEKFSEVRVERTCDEGGLPTFHVHMWNGITEIRIEARAVTRAHWTFDQPTRGGMKSHLTYNEYPLDVTKLEIDDEKGVRNRSDWGVIRGNAEHSWGLLH